MKSLNLLLLGVLFVFCACNKETDSDLSTDPQAPFYGKALPCNDYLYGIIDPDERTENYAAFTIFQNAMIFGGEDRIVFKNSINEKPFNVIEENNLEIRNFLLFENKLYAYGRGGIFEIDMNFEMRQISDLSCKRMRIFEDQILLLASPQSSLSNDKKHKNVLKLNLQTDSLDFYTDQLDANLDKSIYDFVINGDEIWAEVEAGREFGVLRFKKNEFVSFISNVTDPGLAQVEFPGDHGNQYLISHNGSVFYYISNGLTDYFLKNETGDAFELVKMYEAELEQPEAENQLIIGSPNAVKLVRDSMYIASANGGIVKFGLSNNDFEISFVRDTALTKNHTTNFYIDDFDNRHFFINNYDEVTQINCF